MRCIRAAGAAVLAGVATLVAVGCGTSPPAPASPTGSPPIPGPSRTAPSATGHIGAGCGFIPVRGSGDFRSISGQRAVTAAASNPQLSVFSSALRSAGRASPALARQLEQGRTVTLFVPVNSAFAGLSQAQVSYLRKPGNLVRVVRQQAVPARVTPAQIARGATVTTLAGSKLVLAKQGPAYRVGQATVVCGNIKTANGTLYVIDRVLLPHR